jgi:hypothetical protein
MENCTIIQYNINNINNDINIKKIYNIKITYGIHILLNMHHIITSILFYNNNIIFNIEIDFETLKKNRNDIDNHYLDLYINLIKEILNIKNVNLVFNANFGYQDWITLDCPVFDKKNIVIKRNNYFNLYKLENIILPDKYICINTKIVNSSLEFNGDKNFEYDFINKYLIIKEKLFEILNNSNYDIVLLGEKNIPDCNEYNFHRDNYGNYIMYNDFINNLKKYKDEIYNDSKDGYNLDNWKKTCYYLSNSQFNIFIGNGGGVHLYSCFKNCIQFGVTDRLLTWIPKNNIETNFFNTNDSELFLNKIKFNCNYI